MRGGRLVRLVGLGGEETPGAVADGGFGGDAAETNVGERPQPGGEATLGERPAGVPPFPGSGASFGGPGGELLTEEPPDGELEGEEVEPGVGPTRETAFCCILLFNASICATEGEQ